MKGYDLIGYAAATLTTVSFVPQALKAMRERDTKSLSLGILAVKLRNDGLRSDSANR